MILSRSYVAVALAIPLLFTACSDRSEGPTSSATQSAGTADAAPEPEAKRFSDVRGEVIELLPDEKRARIRHEKIPDYMEAMTMPFTVRDVSELDGLTNGDAITFRLNVTEDSHWIDQLRKVAKTTDTETSEGETTTALTAGSGNPFTTNAVWRRVREVEILDVGDAMPNYTFTNELGRVVQLDDLKGRPYAFTFIYTRCPIPDFCPRMSSQFMETHRLLKENPEAPGDWQLLSITIDPDFDTVDMLKGYASRYAHDPERWSFLRTSLIDVTAIAEQFGLMFYRPDETISHNLRTVVVDRDGKVHSIMIGNTWEAEDLVASLLDAGKEGAAADPAEAR